MANIKMKKDELIELHKEVYEEVFEGASTKKESEALLEIFFETLERAIKSGKDVPIGKHGYIVQKQRAARKGRNPQTGKEIQIAASKDVGFKSSKPLKEKLNSK